MGSLLTLSKDNSSIRSKTKVGYGQHTISYPLLLKLSNSETIQEIINMYKTFRQNLDALVKK